jgi:hypothetical protein
MNNYILIKLKCINKVFIEATAAELRPIQKQIIGKKTKKQY